MCILFTGKNLRALGIIRAHKCFLNAPTPPPPPSTTPTSWCQQPQWLATIRQVTQVSEEARRCDLADFCKPLWMHHHPRLCLFFAKSHILTGLQPSSVLSYHFEILYQQGRHFSLSQIKIPAELDETEDASIKGNY